MKRQIFRCFCGLALAAVFSAQAFAARLLIPVGEVVGLSLRDGSVTVAAFHELHGAAARDAGICIGDEILSLDGHKVDSAAELFDALKRSGGTVTVCLRRDGREKQVRLSPAVTKDGPRLGIYVREGVTGIGTATYFDPDSGTFGCLGHGISNSRGSLAPMESGWVYDASVESVKRGLVGEPGQLRGAVSSEIPIGSLRSNTARGVFGSCNGWKGEALPVADSAQVHPGAAQILSNIRGEEVRFFDIEILRCHPGTDGRDLLLKVTDPLLLEATGGIVAGMSGSPIIQDGKLVGAVTHVLVNDPTTGYGIFIENMLDAAA